MVYRLGSQWIHGTSPNGSVRDVGTTEAHAVLRFTITPSRLGEIDLSVAFPAP
jgi:hypothetical protein